MLTRAVIIGSNKDLIIRLLFVLSYFIRCSASCYFDVKQEEFDFELLKTTTDSSFNSQLSNEHDESREINIFDLNSSPVTLENNFNPKTRFKTSLPNMNDLNSIKMTNGKSSRNNEFLISPDGLDKKVNNLLNTHVSTTKSKPVDVVDNGSNHLDATALTVFENSNKKSSLGNNSYVRLSSSNESKNSNKQRHISSNSIGENCNAQELPLIEYVFILRIIKL